MAAPLRCAEQRRALPRRSRPAPDLRWPDGGLRRIYLGGGPPGGPDRCPRGAEVYPTPRPAIRGGDLPLRSGRMAAARLDPRACDHDFQMEVGSATTASSLRDPSRSLRCLESLRSISLSDG